MYGIVIGKNNDLKIDHITARLMHGKFTFLAELTFYEEN